jgi:hypothetical protein
MARRSNAATPDGTAVRPREAILIKAVIFDVDATPVLGAAIVRMKLKYK